MLPLRYSCKLMQEDRMTKKNGLVWIISMTMMIMLAACSSESLLIGDQQNIDAKTEIQSSSDEFIDEAGMSLSIL